MPKKPRHPYNRTQWTRLRRRVLERDGYRCYEPGCTTPATTADHIIPANEAPHLFYVESNIRAACAHHNYGRPSLRAAAVLRLNQARGERRLW